MSAPIRKTPAVMGGDACIRGTRIAVWMLVEAREVLGRDDDQIRNDYSPPLSADDLAAAWRYDETHRDEILRSMHEHHNA